MGDDDVEVRRLRDDAQVAGRPGADRRQRPLPAVLLGRHERHQELALEPVQGARSRPARARRPGWRRRRPSCRMRPRPWSWPSRTSPDQGSPVQVAGSPAGTTSTCPDSTSRLPPGRPTRPMTTGSDVRADLLARPVRVPADRGGVGVEDLHRQAERLEPVGEPGLDRVLVARDAPDPDQRGQLLRERHDVDGGGGRTRRGGQGASPLHPRSTGRVRQVTPPDPFSPTSPSATACTSQPAASSRRRVTRVALGHDHHARPDREDVAAQRRVLLLGHLDQPDAQVREQRVQPGGHQRQEHDRQVVRHRRDRPRAGGRARPGPSSTARRTPARRRRRSLPAAVRRRRSCAASGRCTAGPGGARTCRRPRACPAPRSGPASGCRGPASTPPARRARRRGWACPGGAGWRRRRRRGADRTRRRGRDRRSRRRGRAPSNPRRVSVSTSPSCSRRARSRSTGRRKPAAGSSKARPNAGPGAFTSTSRSGAVMLWAPQARAGRLAS